MVDAQAPGLAARVRELGAIPGSGPGWPVRLLEESALLYLLVRARRRQAELPEALSSVVGARLGLPVRAEGPPLRDTWLVLAQYDTADARLTTRRAWLHGAASGRTALLLSYGAAGKAPELTLPVGLAMEAELTWFPRGTGGRAELGERFGTPAVPSSRPTGVDVTEALGRYGQAVREDPWTPHCPVTLGPVVPGAAPRRPGLAARRPGRLRRTPRECLGRRRAGPVAPGRALRRRPGHGLRRVRPPGVHSAVGVGGGGRGGGAAELRAWPGGGWAGPVGDTRAGGSARATGFAGGTRTGPGVQDAAGQQSGHVRRVASGERRAGREE